MLEWPPHSPDSCAIETLWDYLETEKSKRNPIKLTELLNERQDIWHNIPVRVLQSNTGGVGKRAMALKKAKGGHTKHSLTGEKNNTVLVIYFSSLFHAHL